MQPAHSEEHGTAIVVRKTKYLNNIVEQDHRGVKRVTRPMLGCKAFDAAQSTLTGIELMHMLRKGQLEGGREAGRSAAEQLALQPQSPDFLRLGGSRWRMLWTVLSVFINEHKWL